MILMTIYSGVRPGELIQIKKENVFIENSYFIEGIKTQAGKNRIIPMSDKIKPLFAFFLNNSTEGFLFPSKAINGNHMSYNSFLEYYKEYLASIGIYNHTPHDGRHTCSTLLAEAKIPLLERQKILGHASNNITDDVYVHLDIKLLIEDINMI